MHFVLVFLRIFLLPAICASLVGAQKLVDDISFGHSAKISPNSIKIPGWSLSADGHKPQVMSDRIVLTPPGNGNKRGALWAEIKSESQEWTADFSFRATGPERGSGNLQIWYTKEGQSIGRSSIYTVGKFDGLGLVIDTHGSSGGRIRAFLNDGSTDYNGMYQVDALAFAHCDYPYRNLGRPSQLQIKQSSNSFEVDVDGKPCFRSDKIRLPSGYYFGISAASADTPDSFEAFKFILTIPPDAPARELKRDSPPAHAGQQLRESDLTSDEAAKDAPASQFTTQSSQFADLHNRLQLLSHAMTNLFREQANLGSISEQRHNELMKQQSPQTLSSLEARLSRIETRLDTIDRTVDAIRRDVEGKDYRGQLDKLQAVLKDTHTSLNDVMPQIFNEIVSSSSPRVGFFVMVLIAFQLALVGLYVWYKRRRANAPKKFL